MSRAWRGRYSKEEDLLGPAKNRSNTDLNDQSDLPVRFNDKNIPHKHMRGKKTQKYLKESYYHRIECSVVNSLATLMRK